MNKSPFYFIMALQAVFLLSMLTLIGYVAVKYGFPMLDVLLNYLQK